MIGGDGTDQNFPLRVLAGFDLRHGHLPTWNPYIWSGTPLLAGFNAGALYPTTAFFAFLPSTLAWSLAEASVFSVAGLGMYYLLRIYRLSPFASMFGSITWICGGFLGDQLIHIDLVQGWDWVIWMVVAVKKLSEGKVRWTGLLGIFLGLVILAGNPEAMVEGSMLTGVYCLTQVYSTRSLRFIPYVVMGAAIGFAIGAVQWLPGLHEALGSQRGTASYNYFVGGSVSPKFLVLMFVPFFFGGYGRFGVPYYFGPYSLLEVSSYMGVIGLAALFSLPTIRRRDPRTKDWSVWYFVGAVGLVLALGSYTPVSHLTFHIPLYRLLRLPSRNLAWLDMSIAVLVGFWVERVIMQARPSQDLYATITEPPKRLSKAPFIAAVIPSLIVLGLTAALFVAGYQTETYLAGASKVLISERITALRVYCLVQLSICLAFSWFLYRYFVVSSRHIRPRFGKIRVWILIILVVDIGFYFASQRWIGEQHSELLHGASSAEIALSHFVSQDGGGRFAIYDPNRLHPNQLDLLGQPDLNILDGLSSVEGYGSIVPGHYATVTETHQQLTLARSAISDGTFAKLGLSTLLTPNQSFQQSVDLSGSAPQVLGQKVVLGLPIGVASEIPPPGSEPSTKISSARLGVGGSSSWFIGQLSIIKSISLEVAKTSITGQVNLQPGLILPNNQINWLPMSLRSSGSHSGNPGSPSGNPGSPSGNPGSPSGNPGSPSGNPDTNKASSGSRGGAQLYTAALGKQARTDDAIGIAIANRSSSPVSVSQIRYQSLGGSRFELSGELTQTVRPGQWKYRGQIGYYQVYSSNSYSSQLEIGGSPTGKISKVTTTKWGSESALIRVSSRAVLVRSVTYAPGWHYSLIPASAPFPGGASTDLRGSVTARAPSPVLGLSGSRRESSKTSTISGVVSKDGLIQKIVVPPGTWQVVFSYQPSSVLGGGIITLVGLALALGCLVVL